MAESEKALQRVTRKLRCAIYTRKSTDEGLDQAFNSLDAQREACTAFIVSQKHEGWTVLGAQYDDGGYSGGTLERPALKKLITDIEAGNVDVVVVYKVDRLTRALSDFAKLVDVFDRRGVSFVSITQQFNTTTSMGRLTLNVLLSFAQFEREVISERVRDKITASKKKGMWMGGTVPLGYDAKDRKLVVNRAEARVVVEIFRRYLRLKSVRALGQELGTAGVKSKRRIRPDGTEYGQQRFSQGALYHLLQNYTYRGEVAHKGHNYAGEHAAIVDKELWDDVQAVLAENRVARRTGAHTKYPSLLTGVLFDETGQRLTPTYCVKKGTRYRYYVSTSLVTGTAKGSTRRHRIPAGDLETVVLGRLRAFLANQAETLDAIGPEAGRGAPKNHLIERARQIADELGREAPEKIKARVTALVCRVEVRQDSVQIDVNRSTLLALLARQSSNLPMRDDTLSSSPDDIHTLTADARLARVGREMKMLVNGQNDHAAADPSLLRIVARAHDIQSRLIQNTELSVHDVARQERVSAAYIYILLRLAWLAPDITAAIVNGKQPLQLNAMRLMRFTSQLSSDWGQQRALLGFR
jgi:DNA invertase Pin-like site-specific DNA recombinase